MAYPPLPQLLRQLPAAVATLEGPELRYGFVNDLMQELVGAGAAGQSVQQQPGRLPAALLAVLPQVLADGQPYTAKAGACTRLPGETQERCFD